MSENDAEELVTVNGVQIKDNDTLEIQVGFDGEVITFRDEDGTLQDMNLLCYLHFIVHKFIETLTNDDDELINPEGLSPGHVVCHLIQYLHDQHHQLLVHSRMASLASMMGGKDETPEETGMSLFKFGKNGIERITAEELAKAIVDARSDDETETDDDEDEIIVHGSPDDPQRHH